jgi:hypothetical protein
MDHCSITFATAMLTALIASAYADTVKPPPECVHAESANECADVLKKLGKNPFDAFGTAGHEPVYAPGAHAKYLIRVDESGKPMLDENGRPLVTVNEKSLNPSYFGIKSYPIVYTDKNGKRLQSPPTDKDGYLETPFTFLPDHDPDNLATRVTCTGLSEGTKSLYSGDPPGIECATHLFDDMNTTAPSPEKLAADHRKALLECDRQPTWLGVLFCRWVSR